MSNIKNLLQRVVDSYDDTGCDNCGVIDASLVEEAKEALKQPMPLIVITIEGGNVQGVEGVTDDIELEIRDYDNGEAADIQQSPENIEAEEFYDDEGRQYGQDDEGRFYSIDSY